MSVLILIKLFIILISDEGEKRDLGKRLFKKEDDGSSACFLNAFGGKDLMDMYTIRTKTILNDKK